MVFLEVQPCSGHVVIMVGRACLKSFCKRPEGYPGRLL